MVKKHLFILIATLFIHFSLIAQEKPLCPVHNTALKRCVLYGPNEKIGDETNTSNLILTSFDGNFIYSPVKGKVVDYSLVYYYDLKNCKEFSLIPSKPYLEQKIQHYSSLGEKIDTKCLNARITIETEDGHIYQISGIVPEKLLTVGKKVKKGQLLGNMSYAYHNINKPCIFVSVKLNNTEIDPLKTFQN